VSLKHVISVSGGKDSTATLLIALERCRREDIIAIFCDTGNEHEQTYEYLAYLEQALDIRIHRLKAEFSAQLATKRMFIARDQRTGRVYESAVVFDACGNPVSKRDTRGNIVMRTVTRNGVKVAEPVQKTKKVGSGRRLRWSNKAKRRALAVLMPTGNPFLDLCLWKGRFPSSTARFCTQELKRDMAVAFQLDLIEQGFRVLSWQGVRRDESHQRRGAKLSERIGPGLWAFRPIVAWTSDEVFRFCSAKGIQPNPLYKQGMSRVGCMPCINVKKAELRQIASRFPAHIERIAEWEHLVGQASKRGFSTFLSDAHDAADRRQVFADLNIWARVEWSKTTRGGRQFDLLADLDAPAACASAYGLCE